VKVKVQTLDAKASGDIELNDGVFAVEPRADILHRVVTWQLEKRRAARRHPAPRRHLAAREAPRHRARHPRARRRRPLGQEVRSPEGRRHRPSRRSPRPGVHRRR